MSDNAQYGKWYFGITTKASNGKSEGIIYLMADSVAVSPNGDLAFWREREGGSTPNLIVAAGHWTACFAASVLDGSPCAVDHWPGVKEAA